jgi:hypothetical protein
MQRRAKPSRNALQIFTRCSASSGTRVRRRRPSRVCRQLEPASRAPVGVAAGDGGSQHGTAQQGRPGKTQTCMIPCPSPTPLDSRAAARATLPALPGCRPSLRQRWCRCRPPGQKLMLVCNEPVQHIDCVRLAVGDVDEAGNGSMQIAQRVHLDWSKHEKS